MNQQHEDFVNAMTACGDKIIAYQTVYPGTSDASALAAANRLLRIPEIKRAVDFDQAILNKKAKAEALRKGKARVKAELATIGSCREVLTEMIHGTYKRKRIIKFKDRTEEVEEDIPAYAVLRAIELNCRIEAGYDFGRKPLKLLLQQVEEERNKDLNLRPDDKQATACVIIIGSECFDNRGDDEKWLKRYAEWKAQNPDKVCEWVEEISHTRVDTWIVWDEDTVGFPDDRTFNKPRKGNKSVVHLIRYPNGEPYQPFIPGVSELVTEEEEDEVAESSSSMQEEIVAADSNSMQKTKSSNNTSPYSHEEGAGGWSAGQRDNVSTPAISPMENNPPSSNEQGAKGVVKHEQSGTIQPPSKPHEQGSIQKTDKIKTQTDLLWEEYRDLNTTYKHLSPKNQKVKEQWFRGLNRENQLLHLEPWRQWAKQGKIKRA